MTTIGVVSDTHGHVVNTRQAVALLAQHDIAAVLHCGDIGSTEIVAMFDRWPTHFVFGNVDYDAQNLRAAIETAGQTCHERFGSISIDGTEIALIHSDDGATFRRAIASGDFDLVCYGHTHQADSQKIGRTLVLNPGAIYRATPHSIALVRLPELKVDFLEF